MIGATDYTGLATLVSSLGAVLVSIIGALAALKANGKVSTPPGAPNLGELGANVAAAVTTPPGVESLGQVVAETASTIDHVHEAVCNPPEDPAQGEAPTRR